jgi:hypothetical protein
MKHILAPLDATLSMIPVHNFIPISPITALKTNSTLLFMWLTEWKQRFFHLFHYSGMFPARGKIIASVYEPFGRSDRLMGVLVNYSSVWEK